MYAGTARGGSIVNREFPFVSQTLIAAKTITCSSWPAIEWGRNAQSYLMRKPSWMVVEFEQGEGGSGRKGKEERRLEKGRSFPRFIDSSLSGPTLSPFSNG